MTKRFLQKDVRKHFYLAILFALVAVRLGIAMCQRVFLVPEGAGIDDMLMIRGAMSIAQGEWLGAYSGMTIAKNMGFSLWLALLRVLGLPVLVGNAMLWVGACAFAARALRPLFKGNLSRLCLFGFLAFQPVSYAEFTMRVYRDAVFPALSLLLFAGVLGLALRLKEKKIAGSLLCALGAGLGLAGVCLTREDGAALLVFAICGLALVLFFCLLNKSVVKKLAKSLFCLLPFMVYAVGALAFAGANYAHYGVFKVNDLSSGTFPQAYSSLAAASQGESGYRVRVPVSAAALSKIYNEVPSMQALRPYLQEGAAFNGFANTQTGEFGGSFYFALRLAADYAGLTPTGTQAQMFWQTLNDEVGLAVQQGRLQSARPTGNILPRWHKSLLDSTMIETGHGFFQIMQFEGCDPRPKASIGPEDKIQEVAAFLRSPVQTGYVAGSSQPYYSWLQRMVFALCDVLTWLYSMAVWVLLAMALYKLGRGTACALRSIGKGKVLWQQTLPLLLAFGLFLSLILRLVIAAYMEVAAFDIGTAIMYLSGGVPALLLFFCVMLALPLPKRQKSLMAQKVSLLAGERGERDLRLGWLFIIGILLILCKLLLASAQQVYLHPAESGIDDMMMLRAARSISEGNWLGEYGWLTLSKHTFFALWLAGLNLLKIPYLLAGQLLWCAAALAGAGAMHAALKKRWLSLLLFAMLLFNPASVANPLPFGFVTRVYRDNIFPALCVLCVAGIAGYALRYKEKLGKSVWWLVLAGFGFAACWLTREDGWWLLPFAVVGMAVSLVFILRFGEKKKKLARCLVWVLPFAILGGGILGWQGMNKAYYGRFITSDFSSGEFASAVGAMSRIEHENWHPKVMVPKDVRQKLYENVPSFALLEERLESERMYNAYSFTTALNNAGEALERDYSSGAFYWALREAAAMEGKYDSPELARQYFTVMAEEINAFCDSEGLNVGVARSSVNPPIKAEYIWPVLKKTARNLWFCARFEDSNARSIISVIDGEGELWEEKDIHWAQEFLHEEGLFAFCEGTDQPYYSGSQKIAFRALDLNAFGYGMIMPLLLLCALCWQVLGCVRIVKKMKNKKLNGDEALLWCVQLGLLFCIVLRAAMIAFVTVSSFTIGVYIMYLASIHPLMILFGFVGTVQIFLMCKDRVLIERLKRKQKGGA